MATTATVEDRAATAREPHERSRPPAERSRRQIAGLVELAADGDVEAWNEIVHRYDGLLRSVARGYRLSDADSADVAQTAWLRLIQHLDGLSEPSRVGEWLVSTARRECLRKLRASGREVLYQEPPAPRNSEMPPLESTVFEAGFDAALWSAFGRLPACDQALLRVLLRDPQPGCEEVGAALEMPVANIGPTRGRALERLCRELARSEALIDLVTR